MCVTWNHIIEYMLNALFFVLIRLQRLKANTQKRDYEAKRIKWIQKKIGKISSKSERKHDSKVNRIYLKRTKHLKKTVT